MRTIYMKIVGGLVALAAVCGSAFVLAQDQLRVFPPRQFNTQQTHYIRFVVNYNSCTLSATNAGTCTVRVGALPYNAFVVRAYQQVVNPFNSGTADSLSIGISSTNANELVAAQSIHTAGNGAALTILSPNLGVAVTGSGATPTGRDGGFELYWKWTTGGTNATQGQAIVILEYFAPNDGSCAPVPLGATAGAC
jgi:hypothetical protein